MRPRIFWVAKDKQITIFDVVWNVDWKKYWLQINISASRFWDPSLLSILSTPDWSPDICCNNNYGHYGFRRYKKTMVAAERKGLHLQRDSPKTLRGSHKQRRHFTSGNKQESRVRRRWLPRWALRSNHWKDARCIFRVMPKIRLNNFGSSWSSRYEAYFFCEVNFVPAFPQLFADNP